MPINFNSFGDIVAVLQLAWQLRAALNDATGASAEIRALIADIDSFTQALQHTRASLRQRRTSLQPAVENGIVHAVRACHNVLCLVLQKVAFFETRMTCKVGAPAWRHYWTVAAWSILGGRKEVDRLRTRLSEQLNVIQTYLSLSHANDQDAVRDAASRQPTTLERVYSVLQDIQLRFDVGLPTFLFYDRLKGEYYQPFARTSFSRFMQLLEACNSAPNYQRIEAILRHIDLSPGKTHIVTQWLNERDVSDEISALSFVDCCFFRERAFDEWQVLLGFPYPTHLRPGPTDIMKHLVTRKHAPNTACNCDAGPRCRDRYRVQYQMARYNLVLRRAHLILNQICYLSINMDVEAYRRHVDACSAIWVELDRNPDQTFVQRSIIPLLALYVEHQRPSPATIVKLLQDGPRVDSSFRRAVHYTLRPAHIFHRDLKFAHPGVRDHMVSLFVPDNGMHRFLEFL